MKFFYLLFLYLLNILKCDKETLEYYTNYTFISPSSGDVNTNYFYPHYEVGTVYFKIVFSDHRLSCRFTVYDNGKEIDEFGMSYTYGIEHELKIPETDPKPQKLELQVTNLNHNSPYYIYLYNNNYIIPLDVSKYYFYQLSLNNLEINYEINNLSKDIYLKFQSIIEFAEFGDNIFIKLNDAEIEHIFNETSSTFYLPLKQNIKYKINMKCNLGQKFTNKTAMLMYFEEDSANYKTLFYENDKIITYKSIFENNKHYFIDSINLIDGYNLYNFNLNEISSNTSLENLKISIYIKKFSTYDINYIKNNTPTSKEGYNESFIFEKKNSFTIKACKDYSENDKTILIYIEIDYKCNSNILYEYSIKKTTENVTLDFKTYLLNWYSKYYFSPNKVYNNDIIFISTNHSNTIYPIEKDNTRTFNSFYNGYLYVSYKDLNTEANQILIYYNDEKALKKDEEDRGYIQVYRVSNYFGVININNDLENKVLYFEIYGGSDKYLYVKIDSNDNNNYYLYHELLDDKYLYLTLDKMPINIIDFSKKNTNNEISLINKENEYIFKLGYKKTSGSILARAYLIKNENEKEIVISEGKIKMYTFPKNERSINLDIILDSNNLTSQNFINIKIPSNKIKKNLYIFYNNEHQNKTYLLNNSGINLFYIDDEQSINIDIFSEDLISEDIPIMIKFALNNDNLKLINDTNKFILNAGEIGLYKFDYNTNSLKMDLSSEKDNFNIFYYIDYIPDKNTNKNGNDNKILLNPEIFNKKEYTNNTGIFGIITGLKQYKDGLYLIFSFDSKVTINEKKDYQPPNFKLIFSLVGIGIAIIILVPSIIVYKIKQRKRKLLYTPLNESGNNEINFNSGTTSGNYDDNNNYNNNFNNDNMYNKPEDFNYPGQKDIVTNDGNNHNNCLVSSSSVISMDNNADLPAPLPT